MNIYLDIVPDALANLKQLQEIFIYSSPIVKITDLLFTLPNISILVFNNCSLTHIQNLDKLDQLWSLELPNNHLSHIEGIPAVAMLRLGGNLFTEIPTTKDKDKLKYLFMHNNPLKNAVPILSYKNLQDIDLENTTLTSIPAAIDELQKLEYLHLANNKISHFPTSIFNLQHLGDFTFRNNLLSPNDIKLIREAFKKSHPNTYVSM
jgi:Leucine-rich repeat (LRR) protein